MPCSAPEKRPGFPEDVIGYENRTGIGQPQGFGLGVVGITWYLQGHPEARVCKLQ